MTREKTGCLYALFDSYEGDGTLKYIGITGRDPEIRLRAHIYEAQAAKYAKTPKNNWIRSLLAKGQKPHMAVLLRDVPYSELLQAEKDFIAWLPDIVPSLLKNMTEGGEGVIGYILTPEQRQAQKQLARQLWRDPKVRATRIEALRRRMRRPEERRTVSERNRIRWQDPANREKQARLAKGRSLSDESRAKISAANTGKMGLRGNASPSAILTETQVGEAHSLAISGWTHQMIADHYGVRRETISRIAQGRNWAHLELVWPKNQGNSERTLAIYEQRTSGRTLKAVASEFGVSPALVGLIWSGKVGASITGHTS